MGIHHRSLGPMSKQISQLFYKSTDSEPETNSPLRIAEMHDDDAVQIVEALMRRCIILCHLDFTLQLAETRVKPEKRVN